MQLAVSSHESAPCGKENNIQCAVSSLAPIQAHVPQRHVNAVLYSEGKSLKQGKFTFVKEKGGANVQNTAGSSAKKRSIKHWSDKPLPSNKETKVTPSDHNARRRLSYEDQRSNKNARVAETTMGLSIQVPRPLLPNEQKTRSRAIKDPKSSHEGQCGQFESQEGSELVSRKAVSTKLSLPSPSAEQSKVIESVLAGCCVAIPSVAGSGKTTCMLQVAESLPINRTCVIVTYNRALCDECKSRIQVCRLGDRVHCYTIHGLVSKVAGKICNDDDKLEKMVRAWDSGQFCSMSSLSLDLVMLDEAQDLRPLFYRAICHILRSMPRKFDRQPIQLCLVGDPKQLLYDFPTYGADKATSKFMEDPQSYWHEFTHPRPWVKRKLSVSYRLTPKNAAFVNAIWGTNIVGGNTRDPNVPIEYLCKYPFPAKKQKDSDHLEISFIQKLIDEHGPENVMLLAQSVKNERCPIRVVANELMKLRTSNGEQKYHFHVKESLRGYEGNTDVTNKIRVWTFCGSKGCEADVVVVFGFDMMNTTRIHTLNQVGVALSRARKRLVVIHGKSYTNKNLVANAYYPLLGDSKPELFHSISFGEQCVQLSIPRFVEGDSEAILKRSRLSREVVCLLAESDIVSISDQSLPSNTNTKEDNSEIMYAATEFSHFAAIEERRFLHSYGQWSTESGVQNRIDYNVDVQFQHTKEDVSALYGEAITYMLQWERHGFCPNIETVMNDGILRFNLSQMYKENAVRHYMFRTKECEALSEKDDSVFKKKFKSMKDEEIRGKDLISFLNTRIRVQKKREDGERTIFFKVRAMEENTKDDDENMKPFVQQIKSIYGIINKTPSNWIYLANAVMAFGQYHEKWNQIGTDPESYDRWVNSNALSAGLSRLRKIMACIQAHTASLSTEHGNDWEHDSFEHDLIYEFEKNDQINSATRAGTVVGVHGICDWVGSGLVSPVTNEAVDLLEIKYINELGNQHRIQVLVYCAILAIERGQRCRGMIYNARTEETEICEIDQEKAKKFLLDISQFKYDGTSREDKARVASTGEKEDPVFIE